MDGWVVKYQLLNSSAEYVFEWLKSTADENGKLSVFLGEDRVTVHPDQLTGKK